jgi:hypothetical protein
MEIKQEEFDETIYHDAVDDPLDEEEDEVDDSDNDYEGEGEENAEGSPACGSRSITIKKI